MTRAVKPSLSTLNFYCPICTMIRLHLIDEQDDSATCCFCGYVGELETRLYWANYYSIYPK